MINTIVKKEFTKRSLLIVLICMITLISGCGEQAVANAIQSLEDLKGKKIGVPGTGGFYSTVYEGKTGGHCARVDGLQILRR